MASPSSSLLSLGWYCLVETLADSKQAELPLLKELINRVPDFYTAAPESVRERVALRYLEECASTGLVSAGTTTEISKSTEEFLCQNLKRPIPSEPSQNRITTVSNDIRQFMSQKRSMLPKSSLQQLEEYVSGADAKLPPPTEDGPSSSQWQGGNIVDKEQHAHHEQEDTAMDEEQEMIDSPTSAGVPGSLPNDTSQSFPSHNTFGVDKRASEPLQENNPIAIGNVSSLEADISNLEAARTEPSSDDVNQFILKRRAAAPNKSTEEIKDLTPETCIPTEPSRNKNNKKMRFTVNLQDDPSDCENNFTGSQPFSEQNQCTICNKEGQLLTCSREDCGMTVHESCIMTAPSSFDEDGRFYCPCCACTRAARAYARAKRAFSLAKESLSSFLKMEKYQNQEKGEKGKQPAEKKINGKNKGKRADFSNNNTAKDEDDDAALASLSGDASLSWESGSRDSRRRVKKNGRRKEKQVKSGARNVSEYMVTLGGRGKEAKRCEVESAVAQLDKYVYVKSDPGATSGKHKAVAVNEEEAGNGRRREDRVDADVNRGRHRTKPRYTNPTAGGPRRRNMLPWTAEEERALREGMQKFGVTSDGRIPWITILEYRRNVFHNSRLPNDLKDKWRNMMK